MAMVKEAKRESSAGAIHGSVGEFSEAAEPGPATLIAEIADAHWPGGVCLPSFRVCLAHPQKQRTAGPNLDRV
jgi:hypothetical protein